MRSRAASKIPRRGGEDVTSTLCEDALQEMSEIHVKLRYRKMLHKVAKAVARDTHLYCRGAAPPCTREQRDVQCNHSYTTEDDCIPSSHDLELLHSGILSATTTTNRRSAIEVVDRIAEIPTDQ